MDFEKYKVKEDFFNYRAEKKCRKCGTFYFSENTNFCSNCGHNVKIDYETSNEIYKMKKEKYYEDKARLEEQFKKDALEYVGLSNHPKKDMIYGQANMDGHSNGLEDILIHLEKLASFVYDLET